ncbi:MAG: polysaccharide biosynthesis protein [Lachnospiraceae bacterium]|nr:polysaccharide biosynthesis protein [Lachnospiraceae bacterium]
MANGSETKKRFRLQHWQIIAVFLGLYDLIVVAGAWFLALWIRFDFRFSSIPANMLDAYIKFIPFYMVACLLIFWVFRLYRSVWRFASYTELIRVTLASILTIALHISGITVFLRRMPITYYVLGAVFQYVFVLGIRFMYRLLLLLRGRQKEPKAEKTPVMLVGAGEAGLVILRDVKNAKETNEKVVCIIDDDPNKLGRLIDGVQVVGDREFIPTAVRKYKVKKIYIAIPSASKAQLKKIINICNLTGCEIKNLPGMYQFRTGEVSLKDMKDVSVEDLLGREPVRVNLDDIFHYLYGKTCLITGGGGSIGSELARQIASHGPKQLILLDIYENSVYDIQQELKKKHPQLNLSVIIGSVRDSRKMFQVFSTYRPDIVFHAAAHKHVPLMEDSPCEAIKNNTLGTYKTAFAAMAFGCRRFVLISTDKAVNPTNIMGASKRLCEMVVQGFDRKIKAGNAFEIPELFTHWAEEVTLTDEVRENLKHCRTEFVAVRFGNVLGSNGSVIPLFKKQIEAGGPVTVTHPDIIRYFMTIPEAVSLVLEAGTYADAGEIFVLDMGEPVKIDTLARNLIRLSGHVPDGDIKIEYVGLRPGEKLYEERLMEEEGMRTTQNKLIHIGSPIPFDTNQFFEDLKQLMEVAYSNGSDIREAVAKIVPTYRPAKNPEN